MHRAAAKVDQCCARCFELLPAGAVCRRPRRGRSCLWWGEGNSCLARCFHSPHIIPALQQNKNRLGRNHFYLQYLRNFKNLLITCLKPFSDPRESTYEQNLFFSLLLFDCPQAIHFVMAIMAKKLVILVTPAKTAAPDLGQQQSPPPLFYTTTVSGLWRPKAHKSPSSYFQIVLLLPIRRSPFSPVGKTLPAAHLPIPQIFSFLCNFTIFGHF